MKEPKNYEDWLLDAGKEDELGQRVLITYALLQDQQKAAFDKLFEIVRDSFRIALFEYGYKPSCIEFNFENDCGLGAKELTSILDIYQGASLTEYAPFIFAHARDFYHQVKIWENKSLWQYIKWWFKRKLSVIGAILSKLKG